MSEEDSRKEQERDQGKGPQCVADIHHCNDSSFTMDKIENH